MLRLKQNNNNQFVGGMNEFSNNLGKFVSA